jgi:hypothetical protein
MHDLCKPVFRIWMFLGLPDPYPDLLVTSKDPDTASPF